MVGVKHVACPTCGAKAIYAPSNPYRPFCGERCRNIDLGAWASERFRVVEPVDPLDIDPSELPAPPDSAER